jgi:hypothetical protein
MRNVSSKLTYFVSLNSSSFYMGLYPLIVSKRFCCLRSKYVFASMSCNLYQKLFSRNVASNTYVCYTLLALSLNSSSFYMGLHPLIVSKRFFCLRSKYVFISMSCNLYQKLFSRNVVSMYTYFINENLRAMEIIVLYILCLTFLLSIHGYTNKVYYGLFYTLNLFMHSR